MSDKEKNPDFQIEIDEDELVLDENNLLLDEDDLVLDLESDMFEEIEKESDDLLTEEELENLIIGIDEENDILDIPDEEEVLEELKFFDENFSLPEEPRGKKEKTETKVDKKEKAQKEKPIKVPKKPKPARAPREPFDLQFFLIKNKFKLIGAFFAFIIIMFLLTFFLVLNKKTKVEEFDTMATTESAILLEDSTKVGEAVKVELSEEDKAINSLKEELLLVTDETRKKALQDEILNLEEKKIVRIKEEKTTELKKYFDEDLKTINSFIVKTESDILVVAFVVETMDYQEDLYKAISKVFEDKFEINKISFSVLEKGNGLKKVGEITVDINKFNEVSKKDITSNEKLNLMYYQKRTK